MIRQAKNCLCRSLYSAKGNFFCTPTGQPIRHHCVFNHDAGGCSGPCPLWAHSGAAITGHMTLADKTKVSGGRWTGVICLRSASRRSGCGTTVAFVATDPLLACLLMGFPASFLGLMALLAGIAAVAARIEISNRCLRVAAPQWRGCPLPPVRKIQIEWDRGGRAVRHRIEVYHLLQGGACLSG